MVACLGPAGKQNRMDAFLVSTGIVALAEIGDKTQLLAFILAEMGDKTQVATVALAAQYQSLLAVVAGTTLGMMIANVPAALMGDRIAQRMPVKFVHALAALIFALLGIATLAGAGERFGF